MKCWKMIPSASEAGIKGAQERGAWRPMQVHLTFMLDAPEGPRGELGRALKRIRFPHKAPQDFK